MRHYKSSQPTLETTQHSLDSNIKRCAFVVMVKPGE